jgi:hypothetical protein
VSQAAASFSSSFPQLSQPHFPLPVSGVCPPIPGLHLPAPRPTRFKGAPDSAAQGSRSLLCHLNCGLRGTPLECTEVYPNRPAFNKWTSGVWSEEKSHLLTFLPGFLATAEREQPPWTGLSQERESWCGHRTTQITGDTRRYTKSAGGDTHSRISPSIGRPPPPRLPPHPLHS